MKTAGAQLVVVIPGIMGSRLKMNGREIWGLGFRTVVRTLFGQGENLTRLALAPEDRVGSKARAVTPAGLMPDIHVFPGLWSVTLGYDKQTRLLAEAVAASPTLQATVVTFPYDWRLSNRHSAEALGELVDSEIRSLKAAGADHVDVALVGHSMGGLVASYYSACLGGHERVKKVFTIGTPFRGAPKAALALSSADSERGGKLREKALASAATFPSLYELLPTYRCHSRDGGGLTTFGDVIPVGLEVDAELFELAKSFHDELERGFGDTRGAFDLVPFASTIHPTPSSLVWDDDGELDSLETIGGRDERGDGTVPTMSAVPGHVPFDSSSIHYYGERHG